MGSDTKLHMVAELRTRIATLEKRPALDEGRPHASSLNMLVTGASAGVLHEVWTDHYSHASALLGFGLGQARGLITQGRLAVLWLQISHEAQEDGLPYGAGLAAFGFDPDRLIIGRMKNITDLLWAVEEAVSCSAVAAVIVDVGRGHKMLDFTVTRRLNLRAAAAGCSVFLMRYGHVREASAATYRWHVAPVLSAEAPFDQRAPGGTRWHVRLEKGQRLQDLRDEGQTREEGRGDWILNWTKNGFAIETDSTTLGQNTVGAQTLYGALPAAVGNRLPQTG